MTDGQWRLETRRGGFPGALTTRYDLTLQTDMAGAQRIAAALTPWRGSPVFQPLLGAPAAWLVAGIEVTVEEAALITGGVSPLDVVCQVQWPCDYILRVVPEDLSGALT